MTLLFVCSGNTCRSPLAWAAWQKLAREATAARREKLALVEVISAGLCARRDVPATDLARRIGAEWNVDLSEHRARSWDADLRADWIVAMTREQRAQIRFRLHLCNQDLAPQLRLLGSFAAGENRAPWEEMGALSGEEDDIFDPYGGSLEAYQECGARILRGVSALQNALCEAL